MPKKIISAVDLFCGVGGLTHGLERSGVTVSAGIDIESSCAFPYEANNGGRFISADVFSMNADSLTKLFEASEYTLLAGCAPCQPFSTYSQSGRGKKYSDQWPLLRKFGSLVKETQPDFVTMENVPQLVQHSVFDDFLSYFDGYHTWWDVADCAKFGIPQTRKRLVFLASKHAEGLSIRPTHELPLTVGDTIASLPALAAGQADSNDPLHVAPKLSSINLSRIRASKPGGTWRDWPVELQADCHRRETGATYPSVYGRMEWDRPSPTMTTQCFGYGNGRFGHPSQDRAITLREAAMLQTFPRGYRFCGDDELVRFSRLGRLIGNAVPVRLGEVIGEALLAHVTDLKLNRKRAFI